MKTKLNELTYMERKALERYYELKSSGKHEVLAGLIRQSDLSDVDLRAIEKELTQR